MADIVIDEEFEHLLPPLSSEELENLESDIVENGLREAIIVWAGTGILVDGHNRYRICKKHGIGFGVFEKRFDNRTEAANWIVRNQKTRRNMTKGQEADVGIRLYKIQFEEEAKAKQADGGRKHRGNQYTQNGSSAEFGGTSITESSQSSGKAHDPSQPDDNEVASVDESPEPPQPSRQKSAYEADVPIEVVHVPDKTQRKPEKNRENETAHRIAEKAGVGVSTVKQVMAVHKSGEQDLIDGIQNGKLSANGAYKTMRRRKLEREKPKHDDFDPNAEPKPGKSVLHASAYDNSPVQCDALITEAPSDASWLMDALVGVSRDGFAYVIVDDDVDTLRGYMNAATPMNVELSQVLVWQFTYLLGNRDTRGYKSNKRFILFYRGTEAPNIKYLNANERESVMAIDADGGRLGDAKYEIRLPNELAERLIRHSTKEGDTVFDPFAKRGTILLAAKRLGRDAIGYEEDDELANIAFDAGVERG